MSRLNNKSSLDIKAADSVAVVFYPENIEGHQYGIATWTNPNGDNGGPSLCLDGSGMIKLYPSRAKAIDAIRRLNSSFNASNVRFYVDSSSKTVRYVDLLSFFKGSY